MKVTSLTPLTQEALEAIGLEWHTDLDSTPYVAPEMIEVSQEEAQAYYDAGNELYDMFCDFLRQGRVFPPFK